MAADKDNGPLSDTEGGEKPVREQLQKANLGQEKNMPRSTAATAEHEDKSEGNGVEDKGRGRLNRKRSHDDMDAHNNQEQAAPPKTVQRKRSRSTTHEEDELNNGSRKVSGERPRNGNESLEETSETSTKANGAAPRPGTPEAKAEKREGAEPEEVTSPKTKRSRLLSSTTAEGSSHVESKDVGGKGEETSAGEHKIPASSGFANSSAVSPFGALAGSKSPAKEQETSSSAFASSGFGALAGSSTSGFGAIGKESGA